MALTLHGNLIMLILIEKSVFHLPAPLGKLCCLIIPLRNTMSLDRLWKYLQSEYHYDYKNNLTLQCMVVTAELM